MRRAVHAKKRNYLLIEVIASSRLVNSRRTMTGSLKQIVTSTAKCFQCRICSNLISMPVVTRCGHSFCHACISTVLGRRKSLCPICKTLLTRRSIHSDEQIKLRISKLLQMIDAIRADTGETISVFPFCMDENKPTTSTSGDEWSNSKRSQHIKQKMNIINGALRQPTDRKHCNIGLENTANDEQETVEEKCASLSQRTSRKIILSLKRKRESSTIPICSETPRSSESPRIPSPITKDTQDTIASIFEESEIRTPPKRQQSAVTETPRKRILSLNRNRDLKADKDQHNGGGNVQVESVKRDFNDGISNIKIEKVWSVAKDVNRKNIDVAKEVPSVRKQNTITKGSGKRWVFRRLKFEKLSRLVKQYPSDCYFLHRAFCKRKRTRGTIRVKVRKTKGVTATPLKDKTCDVEVDQVSLENKLLSPVPDEKECEVIRGLSQTLHTAGPFTTKENFETECERDIKERSPSIISNMCEDSPQVNLHNVARSRSNSKDRFLDTDLPKTACNSLNMDKSTDNKEQRSRPTITYEHILDSNEDLQFIHLVKKPFSNVEKKSLNMQDYGNSSSDDKQYEDLSDNQRNNLRKTSADEEAGPSWKLAKKRLRVDLLFESALPKVHDSNDETNYKGVVRQTTPIARSNVQELTNVSIEGVNLCTSKTLPANFAPTDMFDQMCTISGTTDVPKDVEVESDSHLLGKAYEEVASWFSTDIWFKSLKPHDDLERTPSSKSDISKPNCLPTDENANIPRFSISLLLKKPITICNMSTNDEDLSVVNESVNSGYSDTTTSQNSIKESTLNTEMFSIFPEFTEMFMGMMQVNWESVKGIDFDAEFLKPIDVSIEPMKVQVSPKSDHELLPIIRIYAAKRPNDSSLETSRTPGPPNKLPKYEKKICEDPKPSTPQSSTDSNEGNEVAECAHARKNFPNENPMADSPTSENCRTKDSLEVERKNSYVEQDVSNEEDSKASKLSPAMEDEILPRSCDSKSAKKTDLLDGKEHEQIELGDQNAILGHQMLSNELDQDSFTDRIIHTPQKFARTKSFSRENRQSPRLFEENRAQHSECTVKDDDVIVVDILPAKSKITSCNTVVNLMVRENSNSQFPQARAEGESNHGATRRPWKQSDVRAVVRKIEGSCQSGICLVGSHLLPNQRALIITFARCMRIPYVDEFSKDVTHVVVNANEKNAAEKTLNSIRGIAHKKWVVSFQWVQDCMRTMKLLKEEPYEVLDAVSLEPGPRNSRLRTRELFEGFTFLCVESFSYFTLTQYQELLCITGATVVRTMDELFLANSKLKCVVFKTNTQKTEILETSIQARLVPVTYEWIADCISRYKLLPLRAYLQKLQAMDVLAADSYKELLVKEEFNSDDDPRYGTA